VDRILDVVGFTNLTGMSDIDDVELTGVLGYAQWVEDVRAAILYFHENEVIEGFYFDIIGEDTTENQLANLGTGVLRISGQDRVETSILLSQDRFEEDTAGAAVLAYSQNFPDGLAAVPLSDKLNAPLLLTSTIHNAKVLTEVERVLPDGGKVVLVGGETVIPASIEAAYVTAGFEVVRHAGTDRYDTAVKVAEAIGTPASVMLATGVNYPDALSGGPAAARMNGVIILTKDGVMPAVSADYLAANDVPTYALGGPAAAADPTAQAIVGTNRYETAAKVATEFFEYPFGVGVASGENYPDALSGGADAAAHEWPLLLTYNDRLSVYTGAWISEHPSVVTVHVYGGVITPAVVDALRAVLR
jgi:putative cell wall-binding protein